MCAAHPVTDYVYSSEVMLRLRRDYVESQNQLSEIKLRVSELEAEMSLTKRALVTAQSDCTGPQHHPTKDVWWW